MYLRYVSPEKQTWIAAELRNNRRMARLHVGRIPLAVLVFSIWLLPPALDWLAAADTLPEIQGQLRDALRVPEVVRGYINAITLICGPVVVFLSEPPAPMVAKAGDIEDPQRSIAGIFDFAAIMIAIALPIEIGLQALDDLHTGQTAWWNGVARPHGFINVFVLPAWLAYTAWHLGRRKQTLGQYVARYRLVHPGPPVSWREPLYQSIRVFFYGAWVKRGYRHKVLPQDYAYGWYKPTLPSSPPDRPGWYASAGVVAEELRYDE